MDKTQELNLRLTLVVKALEGKIAFDAMGFKDIKDALDWVTAPAKNSIIPASLMVTQ